MCISGQCNGSDCQGGGAPGQGCDTSGGGCLDCWFGRLGGGGASPTLNVDTVFDKKGNPHPEATEGKFGMVVVGGYLPKGLKIGDLVLEVDGRTVKKPHIWTATLHKTPPRTLKIWRKGKGVMTVVTS